MHASYSIAQLTALNFSPPEMIDLAARTGYDQAGVRLLPVVPGAVAYSLMDDKPMLYVRRRGEFNPKHGKGRKVVLEKWVYATLEELGPVRQGDALEHLGTWIRGLLPADARITKPIHELRKCWVSAKGGTPP